MPSWYNDNRALSLAEMQNNAANILSICAPEGWTTQAIAALAGNMEIESYLSPGVWENFTVGSGGFGLVQWTPASKVQNWILQTFGNTNYSNGDYQMARIFWELQNGEQWISTAAYPLTFQQFTQSTNSVEYLAQAFLANYERGDPTSAARRAEKARYWHKFYTGEEPPVYAKHPVWFWEEIRKKQRGEKL